MTLTREQVLHVARLARLALSEEEVVLYTKQLSSILGYVEILETLDVLGVPPTFHVQAVAAPLRPDVPEATQSTEEALRNAPARSDTSFLVPKVIAS